MFVATLLALDLREKHEIHESVTETKRKLLISINVFDARILTVKPTHEPFFLVEKQDVNLVATNGGVGIYIRYNEPPYLF